MKENYCSNCGREFSPGDLSVRCRLCLRNYHARCWEKTGGCTTWGCAGKPEIGDGQEAPEYKRCPYCGEEIISFAVKCRYCRSLLDTNALKADEVRYYDGEPGKQVFRKDPILTSLINLIFPGAGYMYLGQFSKGLIWFLVAIAAWYFTRGLGLIAVYLWVMYDSARQAIEVNRSVTLERQKMQRS